MTRRIEHAYRRKLRLSRKDWEGWPDEAVIEDRGEFREWLGRLRSAVSAGRLEQYHPSEARLATKRSVLEVTDDVGWPRYIEWYFRVPGKEKRYKFVAEIYNGTFATWELISESQQ
jgi:hypothetical protein